MTEPVPPSVALAPTVIAPVLFVPLNSSDPAEMLTGPRMLLPERICFAAPVFANVPLPVIEPSYE